MQGGAVWQLLFLLVAASAWGASAEASPGPDAGGSAYQWMRRILDEIVRTQGLQFFLAALQWTLLGALLGLVSGVLTIVGMRALGWYQSGWKHAKWFRWLFWGVTILCCILFVGTAGFWKGVIQGGEQVVRKSQLATQVFPEVGDVMADGVAALHLLLAETNATDRSETSLTNQIARFRAGAWEVDARGFVRQLDRVQSGTVSNLVAAMDRKAVAGSPMLSNGIPNVVLHQSLSVFGAALLQTQLNSEIKRLGLDTFYHALRDKLVVEARQRGNPDTISHPELSAFIVDEAVIPMVMRPIHSFAGTQAKLALFLALVAAVLPTVAFRLTFGRIKPAPGNASPPPAQ